MRHELVRADALSLLRQQGDDTVPLIVADPPYGIGYHSNHYKGKNPHAPVAGDWNFEIGGFLSEVARVLRPTGAAYIFCRWDVTPLWMPAVISPLKIKTVIVWVKDNWSAGDLKGSFGNQYEQVLFIAKGRHLLRGRRHPNVWNFPRVGARKMLHPTQKPVPLVRRMIESSTDVGDWVLDPFAGSGTTGVAAAECGRDYLLGDIDPEMVRLAARRLGLSPPAEIQQDAIQEESPYTPPSPDDPGLHPDDLRELWDFIKSNRREAAGVLMCMKAGIAPRAVRRPLSKL